ncbi:hypothetical protein ACHAXT_003476 [Thalassiosira profunda]
MSVTLAAAPQAFEFDLEDKEPPSGALHRSNIGDTANAICDSRHHNALLVCPEFALDDAEPPGDGTKGRAKTVEHFDRKASIFAMSVTPNSSAKSVQEKKAGTEPRTHTESIRNSRRGHHPAKTKNTRAFVEVGDVAPDFELEDGMGLKHKLSSYRGRKILLSFFRFAACPSCLYSIDMMKKQYEMLRKAGIVIICVFKSTPENIRKFASQTLGDAMLALSDKQGSVYKTYQVKKSTKSAIKSPIKTFLNRETLKPYLHRGFFQDASVSGMRLLPADFLIDEDGVILDLFRAEKGSNQHNMPFERIEAIIPEGKRCRCNKRDCISPTCRQNYAKETGKENLVLTGPQPKHARFDRRTCIGCGENSW